MNQFLQGIALVLLILVGVVDPIYYQFSLQKEWMYMISVLILIVILLLDTIAGILFGITLVMAYIKLYGVSFPPLRKKKITEHLIDDITPEHLRNVQSNIVDDLSPDYKGIDGVGVYSSQGGGIDNIGGYLEYPNITGASF